MSFGLDIFGVGSGSGYAIRLFGGYRAVVEGNRVGLSGTQTANTKGIFLEGGGEVQVVGNRLTMLEVSLEYSSSSGKYRDNLTVACTTPYIGGTNAGNNQ